MNPWSLGARLPWPALAWSGRSAGSTAEPTCCQERIAITAAAMLLFDLAAIATGNFRLGASEWMTGFEVLPHLPIEELAFLVFLAYVSLVAFTGAERLLGARSAKGAS